MNATKKKQQSREERLDKARKKSWKMRKRNASSPTTTEDADESEFKDTDCDSQTVSESEEGFTPIVNSMIGEQLHPSLVRIYQGDYDILLRKASRFVLIGDYQFLADIRSFYAPRKVLFKLIRVLFPFIPISYNTFLQRTVTIVRPRNRTDLCSICHQFELLQSQARRSTVAESTTANMDKELRKFEVHKARYLTQRQQFISQRELLGKREILLVIDFKENIKYPIMKDQEGKDFYRQKQITCLSCVCYKRSSSGDIDETIFTFFSKCTKHNGAFTIYALEYLFQKSYFDDIDKLIWWSDGGPHFKNREVITKLLHTGFSNHSGMITTVNFFAPYHGKSSVDGIFGFFAHLLKDWLPKRGLQTIEQIHSFFERCCSIVEMCTNCKRHYEFQMFVFFSLFASLGFVELTLLHQTPSIPNSTLMRLLAFSTLPETKVRLSVETPRIRRVNTALRYL